MRIYNMDYRSYSEVRSLSLIAYKQIFRGGDIFRVIDGNGETIVIKASIFK